jgi:hypothetical protein
MSGSPLSGMFEGFWGKLLGIGLILLFLLVCALPAFGVFAIAYWLLAFTLKQSIAIAVIAFVVIVSMIAGGAS